ncbi:HAD family hydrolase [Nocardioides hwasunensis]|uniref:HAD family phosphatase n=1 Tax=Nocardioides hwasunensis TaxID=397258 RepID=A0ABR8MGF1_9ACTN|nr:HAD family phosphatase [Nocardioides hwasunensis]MBD3915155.1 HAD family phosphatase [Nocardioides hwasunensis]
MTLPSPSGPPASRGDGAPVSALLLDLDGTLVNSEPLHREGYRVYFAQKGWDVPDLTIFTGRRALDVLATEPGPWSGLDPQAVLDEILEHVPDEDPEPVPGARELILTARSGRTPVAIVTSAGPAWVERSLGSLGLGLDDVDLVVTALDVTAGKPDPEGFALACERLGADPAAAVAAEDSPAGIRAAVAAGVRRVHGIATTHAPDELTAAGAVEVHVDARPLLALLAD